MIDTWKSDGLEPEVPEIDDLYECDCCGGKVKRDQIAMTSTTCGLETFACDHCRGWK